MTAASPLHILSYAEPAWYGYLRPILGVAASDMERWSKRELKAAAFKAMSLTPSQMSETIMTGQTVPDHRANWAITVLQAAGALSSPSIAVYELTEAGLDLHELYPSGIYEPELAAAITFQSIRSESALASSTDKEAGTAESILPEELDGPTDNSHNDMKSNAGPIFEPDTHTDEVSPDPEPQVYPAVVSGEQVERATATVWMEPAPDEDRTVVSGIEQAVMRINLKAAADLIRRLRGQSPLFFEKAVIDVLIAMGYGGLDSRVRHIGGTGDGGVDGVIDQDALGLTRIYVQAKRYAEGNTVGRPELQGFIGALEGQNAKQGVFVTTSSYTKDAVEYAEGRPDRLAIIDGKKLAEMMIRYGVGVQVKEVFSVVGVDRDYFA